MKLIQFQDEVKISTNEIVMGLVLAGMIISSFVYLTFKKLKNLRYLCFRFLTTYHLLRNRNDDNQDTFTSTFSTCLTNKKRTPSQTTAFITEEESNEFDQIHRNLHVVD